MRHARLEPAEGLHEAAAPVVQAVERSRRQLFFIIMGMRICGEYPGSTPSKPAWLTPTIVSGYPFSTIFLPITSRVAAESRLPISVAQHGQRMAALISDRPAR